MKFEVVIKLTSLTVMGFLRCIGRVTMGNWKLARLCLNSVETSTVRDRINLCKFDFQFKGADPNKLAENYITPLHLAANGHHEIIRLLLNKGAKISEMDICGNTALHFAAANNFPHCTNELLTNPFVDVMLENEDGKTAYHLACENKAQLSQAVIENFISNVIS